MKLITLGFVLLALVSSSLALKDAICAPSTVRPDGLVCQVAYRSWVYNTAQNKCFLSIGCDVGPNNFNSKKKCEAKCLE
ncbi:kunitz-like toxin PcKuz2 isoform X2 [Drosophila biarmipes]|uniref:kunitz-like toxin PcKuz2 isoform X2 n=1 Tax=Drosophila biarmipes TaxID=125945 RepID=UPI0021CCE87E|nr:kunitz-like toxin PcKuz2 isoform X2 [Drosophila biarmipes]